MLPFYNSTSTHLVEQNSDRFVGLLLRLGLQPSERFAVQLDNLRRIRADVKNAVPLDAVEQVAIVRHTEHSAGELSNERRQQLCGVTINKTRISKRFFNLNLIID